MTKSGAAANLTDPGKTKSVVIVGGGTAGWMTAAYLKAAFGDRIDVTVVESAHIGSIGVGEATFSDIRHFFEFLRLEESDWMPACNATYKLGVRFEDWREPGHHFYHPFEQLGSVDGFPLSDWWLRMPQSSRFDRDCFVMAALCDAERSPRYADGTPLAQGVFENVGGGQSARSNIAEYQGAQFPYAYHFEAHLLAKFLTKYGTDRGVKHITDNVVDVALDEQGFVSHVDTAENGRLSGDLYIDCTGFRALLLKQALGEPFVSFQDTLPNNSAVALQVPMDMERKAIRPCTTATAQDAGWIWTIPLISRIGTGYVYADEYLSAEDAEKTLREFVGPEAADIPANHIKMRIGRSERSWVKNVVGIGLAAGFVEPLESTGIFFIHHAIEQIVRYFPGGRDDDVRRDAFNRSIEHVMEGVREFLCLHYVGAKRADNQYWKDTKTRKIPDALAERIEIWKHKVPDSESVYPYYHGLPPYSYNCILLGAGGIEVKHSPALDLADPTAAQVEFDRIRLKADKLVQELPSQNEFFAAMRANAK
ncbi:tryptophan halogenase [Actinokineospora alba]|uniref:Tryptophan halogenase n=1 Tax=Actinokineospora alba TaxID=504798 RepID=A0A1H0FWX2_9PSEU|nr:tryptophan halogenase family protein [Actinokineospora alba]TDP69656.1 tryptophan halogenase [Actinokineospora alba]SDI11901.1 tryptophan halogenase [Actinokineospora alba]SDN99071.1 tryptophan halogenase [Actinokineospora alba]